MPRIDVLCVLVIFLCSCLCAEDPQKAPLTKFALNVLRLKDSFNSRVNQMCFVPLFSNDSVQIDQEGMWNVTFKTRDPVTSGNIVAIKLAQDTMRGSMDEFLQQAPLDLCDKLNLCPSVPVWMIEKEKLKDHQRDIKRNTFDATYEQDIKQLPQPYGKPLVIDLKVLIEHVGLIDEVHQKISVNLITFTKWILDWPSCLSSYRSLLARKVTQLVQGYSPNTIVDDETINSFETFFEDSNFSTAYVTSTSFKLEESQFPLFWMPDVILGNSKQTYWPIESLSTQTLEVFILAKAHNLTREWGYFDRKPPECGFKLTRKFTADASCDMKLDEFPVDVQNCNLFFRSFQYPPNQVKLRITDATHLRSDLGAHQLFVYKETRINPFVIPGVGARASCRLTLQFRRRMISVFVGEMVPALLVVIICFTSFWLGLDGINDRLTVGMNCLYALLNEYDHTRKSLPAVSRLTYMDFFMILCVSAVSCQMVHTVVLAIFYRYKLKQAKKKAEKEKLHPKGKGPKGFKGLAEMTEFVVAVKRARRRPKKRIVYQEDLNRIKMEEEQANRPMIYTIGTLIAGKIEQLRVLILEPSVTKDKIEYEPMKFDLIFRFVIPFVFVNLFAAYFIFLLHKAQKQN